MSLKKYIWHLAASPWEKIMEKIEDGPINSLKKVHDRFLSNNMGRRKRPSHIAKDKKIL